MKVFVLLKPASHTGEELSTRRFTTVEGSFIDAFGQIDLLTHIHSHAGTHSHTHDCPHAHAHTHASTHA